jgi:hypothetical protein
MAQMSYSREFRTLGSFRFLATGLVSCRNQLLGQLTPLSQRISPIMPIPSLLHIPPGAPAGANRRDSHALGSFRILASRGSVAAFPNRTPTVRKGIAW